MLTSLNYSMNYGLAVWEGVRTYYKKPLFLSAHLMRLRESAKALMPTATCDSMVDMRYKVHKAIESKKYEFGYLRPILYVDADEKDYVGTPFRWKFDVHYIEVSSIFLKDTQLSTYPKYAHEISAGFFSSYNDYGFRQGSTNEFLKIPANYWNVDRSKIRFNSLIQNAKHNIYEIEKVDEILFRRMMPGIHLVEAGFSNLVGIIRGMAGQINLYVMRSAPDVLKGITLQWLMEEAQKNPQVIVHYTDSFEDVQLEHFEELLLVGTHMEIKSIMEIFTLNNGQNSVQRVWKSSPVTRFADYMRKVYFSKIMEVQKNV